jgi:hypothetical protein
MKKRTFYQESDVEERTQLSAHIEVLKKNKEAFEEEIRDLQTQVQNTEEQLKTLQNAYAEHLLTQESLRLVLTDISDAPQLTDVSIERAVLKCKIGEIELSIGPSFATAVIDGKTYDYDPKKHSFKNCRMIAQKKLFAPIARFVKQAIDNDVAQNLYNMAYDREYWTNNFIESMEGGFH